MWGAGQGVDIMPPVQGKETLISFMHSFQHTFISDFLRPGTEDKAVNSLFSHPRLAPNRSHPQLSRALPAFP